jgi:ligand-binding sensor domain-containing protein
LFFFFFSTLLFSHGYLVHHYTETDGLPGSEVYDMTRDQWGRPWFATRAGIAVYDGVSWEKYSVSEGLPEYSFSNIRTDQNGRIRALCRSLEKGIVVVYHDIHKKKEKIQWNQIEGPGFKSEKSAYITSFQLLTDNTTDPAMAVGTLEHGLFLWNRGNWTHWTETDKPASNIIYGIAALKNKFYVVTGRGLVLITFHNGGILAVILPYTANPGKEPLFMWFCPNLEEK